MTVSKKASIEQLLKSPVADVAGVGLVKGDLWGIEFENELDEDHNPLPQQAIQRAHFNVKRDGSLRGAGYEFVSTPEPLDKLKENIEKLCLAVKELPWSYSRRTSTHVHMNFADKTIPELLKFLALYWMMEPIILMSLKPSRVGNTFCATSNTTRDVIVTSVVKKYTFPKMNQEDNTKYASLNLTTLFKFGTAECRLFHSSFDSKEIFRWLDTLDGILQTSRKVPDLKTLKQKFIDKEPREFIMGVLGRKLTEYYRELGPIDDALREGFRAAVPILRLSKTFSEYESFLSEEELRQKKRLEEALVHLKRDVDILTYLNEAAVLQAPPERVFVPPLAPEAPVIPVVDLEAGGLNPAPWRQIDVAPPPQLDQVEVERMLQRIREREANAIAEMNRPIRWEDIAEGNDG